MIVQLIFMLNKNVGMVGGALTFRPRVLIVTSLKQ